MTTDDLLALPHRPHWELLGVRDAERFFTAIRSTGWAGTHLFLEGASQPPSVRRVLQMQSTAGPYLPRRQTIWPPPEQWSLSFTDDVLVQLSDLAASHAEPELADHLFIYADDVPLVEWPDAFAPDSPILVSGSVSEQSIYAFAKQVAATVTWVDGAVQQGHEADETR